MSGRAIVLAGGWAHPADDAIAALAELLEPLDFEVQFVKNPAEAASTIAAGCDLLVVAACWFTMRDARYSSEQRDAHAVNLDGPLREALVSLRSAGVPVLALHTAVICFDDWPAWKGWLGGGWNWATSWHPEPGELLVRPAADTPIRFDEFTVVDELYQQLDVEASVTVVAESTAHDPLAWLHHDAPGRAAVNLLGHDSRSLKAPGQRNLNARLIDWLLTT